MNRTTRLTLTAGLTLAAALTVGGAAFAAPDVPAGDGTRYVAVQDPAPGQPAPDGRDCPWHRGGPGAAPSAPAPSAPTPAASAA